jgi:uncharacterized membrane protein YeiB
MYVRRLIALAGFGIAINVLTGFSVLELYAFWGFFLLIVRRWSNRALIVLALVLIMANPAMRTVKFVHDNRGLSVEESSARYKRVAAEDAAAWKADQPARQREDKIEREGPFLAIMGIRLKNTFQMYRNPLMPPLDMLPIFILGLLVVRRKVLGNPAANRRFFWIVLGVAVVWLNIPVTRAWALAGTFALFAAQILISRWWMARFRYGPFEWLWRSLTYVRWEPIRRLPEN